MATSHRARDKATGYPHSRNLIGQNWRVWPGLGMKSLRVLLLSPPRQSQSRQLSLGDRREMHRVDSSVLGTCRETGRTGRQVLSPRVALGHSLFASPFRSKPGTYPLTSASGWSLSVQSCSPSVDLPDCTPDTAPTVLAPRTDREVDI